MVEYVIGIDAGGTKTKARLESLSDGQIWQLRDGPGSLTNDRAGAIKRVTAVISNLLAKAQVQPEQVSMVCGIAGANHEVARLKLAEKIADLALGSAEITTDSRISVYGAGDGKPLLCAAIGTGSVAIVLDETGATRQFGGWGFTAGDQGSGADLGRKLIRSALEAYDAGEHLDDKLYTALFDELGQSPTEIMAWLNRAKPVDYARLMHVMQRFPEHYRVTELMIYAGKAVSKLINSALTYKKLPVALIGGMASYVLPYLSEEIRPDLIAAQGDALDGAVLLAKLNAQKAEQSD